MAKLCKHMPEDVELGRQFLGSWVKSTLYTQCDWLVVGVRYDAWDCDCSPINYGTEMTVTVSAGVYGNRNVREVRGAFFSEAKFGDLGNIEVLNKI